MRTSTTVPIDSHALATLRYIRATIDAAGSVAVPGSAGIAVGVIGLIAAALASTAPLRPYWLAVWLIAAVLAATAGGTLVARQSSRSRFTLLGTPLRKVLLGLVPCLFAGAVLTLADLRLGSTHAIAGTWLLLYGCALVCISALTSRTIGVLGGLFALLGCVAFVLPDHEQGLALGIGFGGLHVLYGLLARGEDHGLTG
jgi:hypothetical protein